MYVRQYSVPFSTNMAKQRIPKSTKGLKKLLSGKLFNPVNLLTVKDYLNIYSISNSTANIKPLYRIAFCTTPSGLDTFTIVDDWFLLKRGTNELSFKKYPNWKSKKNYKQWADKVVGEVFKTIPKLNVKKFIKSNLTNSKFWTWRTLIELLVDGTGEMSSSISELMIASYLPLPIDDPVAWQGINNHCIFVTRSRTGKSVAYQNLTGQSPATTYSVPGLFGSISVDQSVVDGDLKGNGMFAFDEFPRMSEQKGGFKSNYNIMNDILTYMNVGENIRSMSISVKCVGTKCLHFYGNIPKTQGTMKDFHSVISRLAGQDGVDATGTRIGHLLYDEYDEITVTDNIPKYFKDRIRYIIETATKDKSKQINIVLKKFRPWIFEKDEEYENYFEDVRKKAEHSNVGQFLKGFKGTWKRVKFGSVKYCILINLDKLYSMSPTEFYKSIKEEVLFTYEKFKSYNYRSFEFLFHTKKAKALEYIKNGVSYEQAVMEGLSVSRSMFYNWKWRYENGKL